MGLFLWLGLNLAKNVLQVHKIDEAGEPKLKEVNRTNVRDAMQTTNLKTLQGLISFDENGDIKDHTVSAFQCTPGRGDGSRKARQPNQKKATGATQPTAAI